MPPQIVCFVGRRSLLADGTKIVKFQYTKHNTGEIFQKAAAPTSRLSLGGGSTFGGASIGTLPRRPKPVGDAKQRCTPLARRVDGWFRYFFRVVIQLWRTFAPILPPYFPATVVVRGVFLLGGTRFGSGSATFSVCFWESAFFRSRSILRT